MVLPGQCDIYHNNASVPLVLFLQVIPTEIESIVFTVLGPNCCIIILSQMLYSNYENEVCKYFVLKHGVNKVCKCFILKQFIARDSCKS